MKENVNINTCLLSYRKKRRGKKDTIFTLYFTLKYTLLRRLKDITLDCRVFLSLNTRETHERHTIENEKQFQLFRQCLQPITPFKCHSFTVYTRKVCWFANWVFSYFDFQSNYFQFKYFSLFIYICQLLYGIIIRNV